MGVTGFQDLSRKLNEFTSKERLQALRRGIKKGSEPVLARARATVPKGTTPHKLHSGETVMPGYAARHLVVRTKAGKRKDRIYAFIGPTAKAYYATQFVELGTSRQGKQPWLVPAFEASQDDAIKALGDAIKKDIERIARKRAAK